MNLNAKIAKYLEEKGIKQTHIASCLGVKDDVVSRMMMGRRKITAMEYMKICAALDIDPRSFFPDLYAGREAGRSS